MNRKFQTIRTAGNIRIAGGAILPKALARIVCRCAECLGPVANHNNGLACQAEPEQHGGLIHRKAAAIEAARREQALQDVESTYSIVDGEIIPNTPIISDRSADNAN